jgi:hypothetical protein
LGLTSTIAYFREQLAATPMVENSHHEDYSISVPTLERREAIESVNA